MSAHAFITDMSDVQARAAFAQAFADVVSRRTWNAQFPDGWAVYVLRQDGVVTYVGKTNSLTRRMREHRSNGRDFSTVEHFMCKTREQMDDLEAILIETHQPTENVRIESRHPFSNTPCRRG